MKLKHIAAGALITGTTLFSSCSKQVSKTGDNFPKAFTKEFCQRENAVQRKLDSLSSVGLKGNKRERDEYLHVMNETLKEKLMLERIKQDSILKNLQSQLDSLKQMVKDRQK